MLKIVRPDRELECPRVDAALRSLGVDLALLDAWQRGTIAGAGLDVFSQEPLSRSGHPLSPLYAMENVVFLPHLTFFTREARQRLEEEALERCRVILEGRPVRVKSRDPGLRAQAAGVAFDP